MMLGQVTAPDGQGNSGLPPHKPYMLQPPLYPAHTQPTPTTTFPANYGMSYPSGLPPVSVNHLSSAPPSWTGPSQTAATEPQLASVYDVSPVSPPPQRERFSYTRYQLELMNGIFIHIRYPNSMQKQLIAKRVGITRDQVKIWFQNRRRKDVVEKNQTGGSKKGSSYSSDSDDLDGTKMVPDPILNGMISELLKYENDPKGKKAMEALRRSRPAETSADTDSRRIGGKKRKAEDSSDEGTTKVHVEEPVMPSFSPLSSTTQTASLPSANSSPDSNSPPGHLAVPSSSSMQHLSIVTNSSQHQPNMPSSGSQQQDQPNSSSQPHQAVPSGTTQHQPLMIVPTSQQIDMVAPPNTTVPAPYLSNSLSEDSLSHDETTEEVNPVDFKTEREVLLESSKDFVPPNKVAPPSGPIKPELVAPLSVHIPGSAGTMPSYSLPQPHSLMALAPAAFWHQPEPPCFPPNRAAQEQHKPSAEWSTPSAADTPGECKVFPFPVVAEPPRYLPAMSAYQGDTYLDPYQQSAVISSYNNPCFSHYDPALWSTATSKARTTSS